MTTINSDLNTRMNMLYEFIYSKSFKGDIVMDKINENDISLDVIKYKDNDELKKEILKGQFKKVYFDEKTNTLIIKRYSDSYSLLYYIKPYDDTKEINMIDSMNNNDALFTYLLSPMVLSKNIKHIALPIVNIDVDFQDIENILKSFQLDEYFKDMIDNKKISNIFSVRVRECFFKSMTLKEFIESEYFDIKMLIYQVLITLDTIISQYKGFTHGYLNESSIFIYIKKSDIPFDIKITNYINSDIPSMYGRGKNKESDLKTFIECLTEYTTIDEELSKLLKEHKYNVHDLLKDKYFKEFTKNISQDKYNMMTNDEYYTGKKKSKKTNEDMVGGASFYRPPGEKRIVNDPNMTNDARRVYRMEKDGYQQKTKPSRDTKQQIKTEPPGPKKTTATKDEKPTAKDEKPTDKDDVSPTKSEIEPEKEVVAEQRIIKNPAFVRPFPKKGLPSYDPNYIPPQPTAYVPKAQYHRDDNRPQSPPYVPKAQYHRDNDTDRKYYDERPTTQERRPDDQYYRQKEQKNVTDYPLIAEQKLYQPPTTMGMPGVAHTHPKYNNPAWVSIDNQMTYPPNFVPDVGNYFPFNGVPLLKPNEIPLQKIYNINLGNPVAYNSLLNNIYQDTIGGDPFAYTMVSVNERTHLIHMLRNRMIDKKDGEDMTMQAGNKSVMEYIRILRFNPYALGKNPYSKIPLNFLIYSGAYPIRYNADNKTIEVAKQSMSVNIRLYNLNNAALNFNKIGRTEDDFDPWREVKYYNFVKNEILNKKISPNFITSILYKLDRLSNINYKELENIIKVHADYDMITRTIQNNKKIDYIIQQDLTIGNLLDKGQYVKFNNDGKPSSDSGVSLLMLTESPTANLIEWASPVMEKVNMGMISNMISTGMHSTEAWESVLFQLLYAMAVMYEKEIYIRSFCIGNNVYVKDLFADASNLGHWIYNINDLEMYVPNYGHVVMIDSSYADDPTIGVNDRKIIGRLFGDKIDVRSLIINDCIKVFSPDDFTKEFPNEFGMLPPEAPVIALIEKIQFLMKKERNFKKVIMECFPKYIHNRVGTLLTKAERDSLSTNIMPKLIKGKLVVYQSRYDEYKWAIYIGDSGKKKNILLLENNTLINKEVFNHSLFEHPEAFNIIQNSEKNYKLTKDTLIEKYCLE